MEQLLVEKDYPKKTGLTSDGHKHSVATDKCNNQFSQLWYQAETDSIDGFALVSQARNINPLLDYSSVVIGVAMRLSQLTECDDIDRIYQRIVKDIVAIEIQLQGLNLDATTVLSWRYLLCCFVDEKVMATAWGADSAWAEQSLLSRFHGETWGGEKVFEIISRMQVDTRQHQQVLYFAFVCLMLGLQGKYKIMQSGDSHLQNFIHQLYQSLETTDQIASLGPEALLAELPESFESCRIQKTYQPPKHYSLLWLWLFFIAIWIAVYFSYSDALQEQSSVLHSQLEQLFNE